MKIAKIGKFHIFIISVLLIKRHFEFKFCRIILILERIEAFVIRYENSIQWIRVIKFSAAILSVYQYFIGKKCFFKQIFGQYIFRSKNIWVEKVLIILFFNFLSKKIFMEKIITYRIIYVRTREVYNGPRVVKFISAVRKQFLVKNDF